VRDVHHTSIIIGVILVEQIQYGSDGAGPSGSSAEKKWFGDSDVILDAHGGVTSRGV
jgi:hypothetical protein